MRTEEEVLKEFKELGYEFKGKSDMRIKLYNYKEDKLLSIWFSNKTYNADCLTMQEHQLLNELFHIWGWIENDR